MPLAAANRLFYIAALLTTVGVAALTLWDINVSVTDFISRLNEYQQPKKSWGSGLFMIIGVFWIGTIDTVRRALEPKRLDPWLRFPVLAFAASYLLSILFPCDAGCPAPTSVNQWLHSTLVWGLSFGPAVFAVRLLQLKPNRLLSGTSVLLLLLAVLSFSDAISVQYWPGVWQRLYELQFCIVFGLWLSHIQKSQTG